MGVRSETAEPGWSRWTRAVPSARSTVRCPLTDRRSRPPASCTASSMWVTAAHRCYRCYQRVNRSRPAGVLAGRTFQPALKPVDRRSDPRRADPRHTRTPQTSRTARHLCRRCAPGILPLLQFWPANAPSHRRCCGPACGWSVRQTEDDASGRTVVRMGRWPSPKTSCGNHFA